MQGRQTKGNPQKGVACLVGGLGLKCASNAAIVLKYNVNFNCMWSSWIFILHGHDVFGQRRSYCAYQEVQFSCAGDLSLCAAICNHCSAGKLSWAGLAAGIASVWLCDSWSARILPHQASAHWKGSSFSSVLFAWAHGRWEAFRNSEVASWIVSHLAILNIGAILELYLSGAFDPRFSGFVFEHLDLGCGFCICTHDFAHGPILDRLWLLSASIASIFHYRFIGLLRLNSFYMTSLQPLHLFAILREDYIHPSPAPTWFSWNENWSWTHDWSLCVRTTWRVRFYVFLACLYMFAGACWSFQQTAVSASTRISTSSMNIGPGYLFEWLVWFLRG